MGYDPGMRHADYMQLALAQAELARAAGDVPVVEAAVVEAAVVEEAVGVAPAAPAA